MHELGIAQGLIHAALETATKNHAVRVLVLNIEMSTIADESEDSLCFHFENLTRGTIAEGMQVNIIRFAAQIKCLDCGHAYILDQATTCPQCRSARLRLIVQDEFRLASIDVE